MTYVTFFALCAIVTTSGPMVEHIILLVGVIGTLWNIMELYVLGKSSGTLWYFIMSLMERNNYAQERKFAEM